MQSPRRRKASPRTKPRRSLQRPPRPNPRLRAPPAPAPRNRTLLRPIPLNRNRLSGPRRHLQPRSQRPSLPLKSLRLSLPAPSKTRQGFLLKQLQRSRQNRARRKRSHSATHMSRFSVHAAVRILVPRHPRPPQKTTLPVVLPLNLPQSLLGKRPEGPHSRLGLPRKSQRSLPSHPLRLAQKRLPRKRRHRARPQLKQRRFLNRPHNKNPSRNSPSLPPPNRPQVNSKRTSQAHRNAYRHTRQRNSPSHSHHHLRRRLSLLIVPSHLRAKAHRARLRHHSRSLPQQHHRTPQRRRRAPLPQSHRKTPQRAQRTLPKSKLSRLRINPPPRRRRQRQQSLSKAALHKPTSTSSSRRDSSHGPRSLCHRARPRRLQSCVHR